MNKRIRLNIFFLIGLILLIILPINSNADSNLGKPLAFKHAVSIALSNQTNLSEFKQKIKKLHAAETPIIISWKPSQNLINKQINALTSQHLRYAALILDLSNTPRESYKPIEETVSTLPVSVLSITGLRKESKHFLISVVQNNNLNLVILNQIVLSKLVWIQLFRDNTASALILNKPMLLSEKKSIELPPELIGKSANGLDYFNIDLTSPVSIKTVKEILKQPRPPLVLELNHQPTHSAESFIKHFQFNNKTIAIILHKTKSSSKKIIYTKDRDLLKTLQHASRLPYGIPAAFTPYGFATLAWARITREPTFSLQKEDVIFIPNTLGQGVTFLKIALRQGLLTLPSQQIIALHIDQVSLPSWIINQLAKNEVLLEHFSAVHLINGAINSYNFAAIRNMLRKTIHVQHINLINNALTSQQMNSLIQIILKYPKITKLIGIPANISTLTMLEKHQQLTNLGLVYNSPRQLLELIKYLQSPAGNQLTKLTLFINSEHVEPQDVTNILHALEKQKQPKQVIIKTYMLSDAGLSFGPVKKESANLWEIKHYKQEANSLVAALITYAKTNHVIQLIIPKITAEKIWLHTNQKTRNLLRIAKKHQPNKLQTPNEWK